jgi:hypothetical protein
MEYPDCAGVMGGNFGFRAADCNDNLHGDTTPRRIIPLHSRRMAGDSPRRFMSLKSFPKTKILLALISITLGVFFANAQDEQKEKPAEVAKTVEKKEAEEVKDEPEKPKEGEKPAEGEPKEIDPDDEAAAEEAEAETAAVARPVSPDPVQVYGWRERILIDGMEKSIYAKLDTGAYTSSIHAEEKELFERDGKKWVRFILTEPGKKDSPKTRIEAPLIRIARIKNPGGESESREVVRLAFKIGARKLRGDFTLNNRSNMNSAILIGRTTIRELGWIDPSRTNLAGDKIMR